MRLRQMSLGLAVTALTALPASGALLINEVVFNEVGSDVTGEWIEIYNNGATAIDLSNYKIGDEETSGGTSTTERCTSSLRAPASHRVRFRSSP